MASVTISANDSDFAALERAFLAVERAADVLRHGVALDGEARWMAVTAADRKLCAATSQLQRIVRLLLIRARADKRRRAKRIGTQTAPLNWPPRTYGRE